MGWKEYYRIGEEQFKENWDKQESWGDMLPYHLVVDSEDHYGVGKLSDIATNWYLSPKIQHYSGKTRITVDYYVYAGAGATGKASIGIVFYKNGETCKDPAGNDLHGASHTISEAPSVESVAKHTFVVEQENGKIAWYVDDTKIGEEELETPLVSFKLAVKVDEANGYIGIVITRVAAEYYDVIEDYVAQFTSMMNIVMYIMMAIMFVMLLFKVFRGGRE